MKTTKNEMIVQLTALFVVAVTLIMKGKRSEGGHSGSYSGVGAVSAGAAGGSLWETGGGFLLQACVCRNVFVGCGGTPSYSGGSKSSSHDSSVAW